MTKSRRTAAKTKKGSADELTAYEIHDCGDMSIEPAPVARQWMDESGGRFAYRCLPLVIANQNGWIIRSPTRFTARWNGGKQKKDLRLYFPRGTTEKRIQSHFGDGILTFTLPYLFRTPPGVNLWVKGPANWIKDGVQALEGIVETDWSHATFTMNWKVTRPDTPIRFEQGEPICMIVPMARGFTETMEPRIRPLESDKELDNDYRTWADGRKEFNTGLDQGTEEAVKKGWQRDYMKGIGKDGKQVAEHQTRLDVKEFKRT